MEHIHGLELCEKYYMEYGAPLIEDEFPDYADRIAVGLVGQGSECYGFDDFISIDHDFGPSFCMWLTDKDYEIIGEKLSDAYNRLPKSFMGYERLITETGGGRVGVLRTSDFYMQFTGKKDADLNVLEWIHVPEHFLAEATNGKIFRDELGEFSKIRSRLLDYYPEDVRVKKIAARAVIMGQSGQYNYSRSMRRSELVAARLAIDEFIKNSISIAYLLNRKYQPFYKWAYKGMENFSMLQDMRKLFEELALTGLNKAAWSKKDDHKWKYELNNNDRVVEIIENICNLVLKELLEQNLTNHKDSFLANHGQAIMSNIKNDKIRNMHVMIG